MGFSTEFVVFSQKEHNLVRLLGSLNGLVKTGFVTAKASLISWGIDNLRIGKGSLETGERSDRVFCLSINYPGSQLVLAIISQLSNDRNSALFFQWEGVVLILKKNWTLGCLNLSGFSVLGVKDDALS